MSELIMFLLGAAFGWGMSWAFRRQRAQLVPIEPDRREPVKVSSQSKVKSNAGS